MNLRRRAATTAELFECAQEICRKSSDAGEIGMELSPHDDSIAAYQISNFHLNMYKAPDSHWPP